MRTSTHADEEAPADEMALPEMTSHAHPSGCGKPPLGFGRSSAITLFMCAFFFCVYATAALLSAAAFGGAGMDEVPGLTVGGAAPTSPETSSLTDAIATRNDGGFGAVSPDAIPPRRHGRHRARQGRWHPVPVFPPPPRLDNSPPLPDYSPGPTDDKAEASIDDRGGVSSSFCSTNDYTPTTPLQFGSTLTVLGAGTAVKQPTSG
ncbi:hypothetical protein CYMTET_37109 [Cymbomonas tetramitiformis]|uniref:Uncharacterized protein n=1 Tax=Cymbomonas tetramitiformis TaxID=36881 RepID=A0AAE0CG54_9CHLO|nr:hypothetical protein CYMTET_37109 [Cymbomonas tetramitiformis]